MSLWLKHRQGARSHERLGNLRSKFNNVLWSPGLCFINPRRETSTSLKKVVISLV